MSKAEKEVLIAVLNRLRALETQQDEDATSLLQLVQAFTMTRAEFREQYNNYRPVAERLISQRRSSDQGRQYDELIEQLSGGAT